MQSLQELKNAILNDLPKLIETEPEIREFILKITSNIYANKQETDNRFDRIMEELKRDREVSQRRLQAQEEKWEAQEKKWQLQDEKWKAQERRWHAQEEKWKENQKTITSMLKSIEALTRKHDSSIGALGARWGLQSESAFRNGLKSILEESFNVNVERYEDYDYEGQVFGRPDQIELDVIIHNGTLILCEIKSSMDKAGMYIFWRKKNFYELKHNLKVTRTMVISPMIDDAAKRVAQQLGIETYSYADTVQISDQ